MEVAHLVAGLLPSGDADIEDFYGKLLTGPGGEPAKGTVLSELIVKFFHGDGETVGGVIALGQGQRSNMKKGVPPRQIENMVKHS